MPNNQKLINRVVDTARSFIGKTEVGNNAGFADPEFQKEMRRSGFERGMSWCVLAAETVYRIALLAEGRTKLWKNMEPLFSAGAVDTFNRFKRAGYTIKDTPSPGDLVVWRHGAGPQGHFAIVIEVGDPKTKRFITVEGNTSPDRGEAIERNGGGMYAKNRRYGQPISTKPGTFNLLGFISPLG